MIYSNYGISIYFYSKTDVTQTTKQTKYDVNWGFPDRSEIWTDSIMVLNIEPLKYLPQTKMF